MKKIFLALLLLPTVVCTSDRNVRLEEIFKEHGVTDKGSKKRYQDFEFVKFVVSVGGKLDWRLSREASFRLARVITQQSQNNLVVELESKKDYFEAGLSLENNLDAAVINTCAMLEQNWRKNLDVGMMSGNNREWGYGWFSSFGQKKFHGGTFRWYGCDCSFYPKLTDEQLEQLRQGTQENLSKESGRVRPAQVHPSKHLIK